MNARALRLLEFETIRSEVSSHAWTQDGRKLLCEEDFAYTAQELEKLRGPVREFRLLFQGKEERPSLSLPSITEYVKLAEKPGAVLEARELADISRYICGGEAIKTYIRKGGPLLTEEAEALPDLAGLAKKISALVDAEGHIRDDAVPSLARLKRMLRSCQREIETLAASYLAGSSCKGYWQSDTASQKDGRLVLPLARDFKGRIKGVVHEISASGATAFFEPLDIFEKNNHIAETENEYRREVFRLLKEITAETGAGADALLFLVERTARIDSWQSRAFFGHTRDSFPAQILPSGIHLMDCRHPLLGKKAVPIDLRLAPETKMLLITGPNTGGKTVALKTVGLFALMNQFGLDLPASSGSGLPLFDDIFVSLGDEQSIAESLSTFSAHTKNLAAIEAAMTSASLVLLDELGSGTAPEEGSALAMAFLDRFAEEGVHAVITSHLGVLKHYAFTRAGISNASVEFDSKALKPAYRIIPGVPGESHAIETAKRCGVPQKLIEAAEAYLSRSETDSSRLIKSLTEKEKELTALLCEQEKLKKNLEEHTLSLAEKEKETAEREKTLRREGLREERRFLDESRKTLEALVREIRENANAASAAKTTADTSPGGEAETPSSHSSLTRSIHSFTASITAHIENEESKIKEAQAKIPLPPMTLAEGMEVLAGSPPRPARLERRLKNGNWLASIGAVRMEISPAVITPAPLAREKTGISVSLSADGTGGTAKFELDIRGLRV
ncbi:MAG: hypothetical protein LBC67_06335, partial [Spirochaetales bacterium]|nr:hypothetical protein [Spirochaetales bacterium]